MFADEKSWGGNSSRVVFRPSGAIVLSTTEVPVKSSLRPFRIFCARVGRGALEPGPVPCRPECAIIDISIMVNSLAPPIYRVKAIEADIQQSYPDRIEPKQTSLSGPRKIVCS
jgi:hypothetical protein